MDLIPQDTKTPAPIVIALSASGQSTAYQIAQAFDLKVHGRVDRVSKADLFFENALDHVRDLFAAGVPTIGVCASGILIRAVAPLLQDKHSEPPLISVCDDGRVVVPLLGGHRGANRIAQDLAGALGTSAAITTAGDVALGIALDAPPSGYKVQNPQDAKAIMASLLSGHAAQWSGEHPPLFGTLPIENSTPHTTKDTIELCVTTKPIQGHAQRLVYHPQQYTLGIGCARGALFEELLTSVETTLLNHGIAQGALACIATIDLKADEQAIIELACHYNLPLRLYTAQELDAITGQLSTPSKVVFNEVGCHGVSEGAALLAAGSQATLAATKVKTATTTCAIAAAPRPITRLSGRPRGQLSIVGIGPGQAAWRTPEVSKLITQADELVGYGLYIDLLGPIAAGKPRSDFPLGGEEARCRYALEQAGKGHNVALVCSGDAGIYAMAALVFELLDRSEDEHGVSSNARRVEVICSPGISALQGAAARAGAPLGHDFCTISLSDLLTPRDDILRRIEAAAYGDFVIAFYNPVSKTRRVLLPMAQNILLKHRPKDTAVMLASNLGRQDEHIRYTTLQNLDVNDVDMLTVVLIGSSNTRTTQIAGKTHLYTPRGYARKIDGDLSQRTDTSTTHTPKV